MAVASWIVPDVAYLVCASQKRKNEMKYVLDSRHLTLSGVNQHEDSVKQSAREF